MQRILENSKVYKILMTMSSWFAVQWQDSRIIDRFLSSGHDGHEADSVIARVWQRLRLFQSTLFNKLRLTGRMDGSLLTKPFIWVSATIFLAPILPTMIILGLSLVSFLSVYLTFGGNSEHKLAYSPVNKYFYLFSLSYIIATFTSVTVTGSLYGGALTALFPIFAVILQNAVASRRQLLSLLYIFALSGAAVSAYGIYQFMFGASNAAAWYDSEMFSAIGMRVYSTLENPNVLAEFLLLVIPFTAAVIMITKKILVKLFFTGCLGVMLVCLLLTFTRGGWLGLLIAAALFLIMLDRRFILAGIFGVALLYLALPDIILDRFLSIGNTDDSSTSYRVFIWMGSIEMLRDFWFTGIGPGTAAFNRIYPLYGFNTVTAPHSHNLYLQIMIEAGISGILIFFAIVFSYFRSLCAAVRKEKDRVFKILQIAAISSVFGFLVQSATDHSFYNYRVMLIFWIVIGLGIMTVNRSSLEGDESG